MFGLWFRGRLGLIQPIVRRKARVWLRRIVLYVAGLIVLCVTRWMVLLYVTRRGLLYVIGRIMLYMTWLIAMYLARLVMLYVARLIVLYVALLGWSYVMSGWDRRCGITGSRIVGGMMINRGWRWRWWRRRRIDAAER